MVKFINAQWNPRRPAHLPIPRQGTSLVYAANTNQVLLFGGVGPPESGTLNDMWAWDGSDWSEVANTGAPPPRAYAMMAYDHAQNAVVLFGGVDESGTALGDTWTWDGGGWTRRETNAALAARMNGTMAYDTGRNEVVLFGGQDRQSRQSLWYGDTWVWDGSEWIVRAPKTSPSPRSGGSMVWDATTSSLLLFGGGSGYPMGDTWLWDGLIWRQQLIANSPPPRIGAGLISDSADKSIVLFGGIGFGSTAESTDLQDIWIWEAGEWHQSSASPGPLGGTAKATVYDPIDGSILLLRSLANKVYDSTGHVSTVKTTAEMWDLR